jgi:hypothetical protein
MERQFFLTLFVAGLLGFGGLASAQAPTAAYETFLPGYTIPSAGRIVVDEGGNAFLIASAHEDDVHLDVLVVKLAPSGDELWNLYIEASNHDYPADLALDSHGDVWVTGWTDSPDFPVVNAMDDTLTGFRDVFLMKLAASDGSILYSTFIGGDYVDSGAGIIFNDADEIYLTGVAGSTDYPTTPDAYQTEPSFPLYIYQDVFVTKLSPAGDEILYSTYFGGTEDDWGEHIALDGYGNIIIAGKTTAEDFPLANAVDATPNDIFVSKFSADGGTLLFSSYLGGSDVDGLSDMSADAAGDVYLTGSTRSVDFPTTPGAFLETFVGAINGCEVPFGGDFNCEDFYVSKLSTSGAGLIWSTFIGGTTVDQPRGVAIDGVGNTYVAGYTNSTDFPLGNSDFGAKIVVCKLRDGGGTLDYTLDIESGSANRGNGIAVADDGSVYFTGSVGVPASIYVSKRQGAGAQVVGVDEETPSGNSGLVLARNYPNPFNPTTRITYVIPEGAGASLVNLSVFDARGRLVTKLVDEPQAPGSYTVTWRGLDEHGVPVSSGVYFYRLRWGSESISRRMVMLK